LTSWTRHAAYDKASVIVFGFQEGCSSQRIPSRVRPAGDKAEDPRHYAMHADARVAAYHRGVANDARQLRHVKGPQERLAYCRQLEYLANRA
jgi:hypothetical protein